MGLSGAPAPASENFDVDYRTLYLRSQRRYERERVVRLEVEAVAEQRLRDLYERERQQALLEAVARHANGTSSEEDAFRFALTEVCRHAGWAFGCVYLPYESDLSRLAPSAIWHCASEDLASFLTASSTTIFLQGVGLPGRVLASGQAHWIHDVAEDGDFPRLAAARECGLRSGIAFPVVVAGEVVAVVEYFSREILARDPVLLSVLNEIGTQLGRVVERARASRRLAHEATHDVLTDLPNRLLFLEHLSRTMGEVSEPGAATYAVLFIDLDGFKLVNDSLGHRAGDHMLIEIATRFSAVTSQQGGGRHTLARIGGDEFTVLLNDIADEAEALAFAGELLGKLREPISVAGHHLHGSASVGVVMGSFGCSSASDLMRDADLAMYRAKALGRSRVVVFDESMHRQAVHRLKVESDLRAALLRDAEFVLHFQPIMSLVTRRPIGFEALVRWQKSDELVYPDAFIEIAEASGLIVPLGSWVMEQACRVASRLNLHRPAGDRLWISVNVSAHQFSQADFVGKIRQVLAETGATPDMLTLEITETVAMTNTTRSVSTLQSLRGMGVSISIDDFGTGHSSLSSLHRLPFDTLKIDRSFVSEMGQKGDGLEIVRTILALARSLSLDVVAEGVETIEQANALTLMGCDQAQGYYFSRPKPEAMIDAFLIEAGYPSLAHDAEKSARGFG